MGEIVLWRVFEKKSSFFSFNQEAGTIVKCLLPLNPFMNEFHFFFGALFQGKGGPPVFERLARHRLRQWRGRC